MSAFLLKIIYVFKNEIQTLVAGARIFVTYYYYYYYYFSSKTFNELQYNGITGPPALPVAGTHHRV